MSRMWRRWRSGLVLGLLALTLSLGLDWGLAAEPPSQSVPPAFTWPLPAWVPRPLVPAENPQTVEKVALGRHLFYEKRLSVTGEKSCGSCHLQKHAFTDAKSVSEGATGETHPRNAMSLTNVAYSSVLTWANPLARSLEQQMLVPLFGENPVEMGMAGRENQILVMLRQDPNYPNWFRAAFPDQIDPISIRSLTQAIAAFERTLISFDSPYDRYRYGGDSRAISDAAKRGEILFNSERLECFHCHGGLNFSDSVQHERLAFVEIGFHNTGLYNLNNRGDYPANNTGVYEITNRSEDMGRFKAPTLRNIALTAPYMHDGSIASLEQVIEHYAAGGRTIHSGRYAGVGSANPHKSQFVAGFKLTPQEKQDLLAFLHSLTDRTFVENPAFRDPADEGARR